MSLVIIFKYISLMTIAVELVRVLPFKRSTRNLAFIKLFITVANILSILFIKSDWLSICIASVTIIYIWLLEWIQNSIKKDLIGTLKNKKNLIYVNHFLTFSYNSLGLTYIKFDGNDTERLLEYTRKIDNDIDWISNLILVLDHLGESHTIINIISGIDRGKKIPFTLLNNIIAVLARSRELNLLSLFMDVVDRDFLNITYRNHIVSFYMLYFAVCGDRDGFNKLLNSGYATEKHNPGQYSSLIESSNYRSELKREFPDMNFSVKTKNRGLMPLYISIGVVCIYSLLQMALSRGGSLEKRVMDGAIAGIDYIRFGAFTKYHVLNGEWVRLLTSALLHGGIIHLALNAYSTLNLGRALFRFIHKRYVFFIFLMGSLGGGFLSLAMKSMTMVSIGASTGVFGLLGGLVIYIIWNRKSFNKDHYNRIMINFIIIGAVQIYFGISNSNINNLGHLGGFIGGVLAVLPVLIFSEKKIFRMSVFYLNIAVVTSMFISIPSMITKDYSSDVKLIKEDFYRPEYWIKDDKEQYYVDQFYLSAFSFNQFIYEGDMENLINEVKIQASEAGLGKPLDEGVYNLNWYYLQFEKELEDYNLYFYYMLKSNTLYRTELYIKPELYKDFEPLLNRIMTKSTE